MASLPIMSVSGIRGIAGESLTPLLVSRIAYLQTKASEGGRIVVGSDTRPTGEVFARAAFRGIRAAGGKPIDIGIAPTPTTCVAVSELRASGGIIITASHNPNPWNGYKMVNAGGRLFRADECEKIYLAFRGAEYPDEATFGPFADSPEERVDATALHIHRICSQVNIDCIRNAGISVAIDSINGAAGAVFPALLEALGVRWIGLHIRLDGDFAHNPEPRPEHLVELSNLLKNNTGIWAGFAFDPDADRLATMGEKGEPVSEEMTLIFSLQNLLDRRKSDVAVNLSTSMVIDEAAKRFGVRVVRTKIGEANVVEGMEKEQCGIGGEGNGGLIYPPISLCRDGLAALAIIIELMAKKRKKLTQLVTEWPHYAIIKEKIPLRGIDPAAAIIRLSAMFLDETTDTLDGLKIIRPNGWVQVRASNTEPIIRCFAEARTEGEAQEMAGMVTAAMKKVGI